MKTNLKKKLILLFLIVGLVPLLSAFIASIKIRSKSIMDQSINSMTDVAKLKKGEIKNELETIVRELKLLNKLVENGTNIEEGNILNEVHRGIKSILIVEGNKVIYSSDDSLNKLVKKESYFSKGNLYLKLKIDSKKSIIGKIDLSIFNKLIENRIGLGKSGGIYILDSGYNLQLTTYDNIKIGSNHKDYLDKTTGDVLRVSKEVDVEGLKLLLVLEKSLVEVNEPIKKMLYLSLAVTLICSILILLMGYYIANSFTKPIINFISKFEKATKGHLDTRVVVDRKDELGILAINFNSFMEVIESIFSKVDKLAKRVEDSSKSLETDITTIVEDKNEGIPKLKNSIEVCLTNISSQSASLEESLASLESISQNSNLLSKLFEENKKDINTTSTLINNSKIHMGSLTNNMSGIRESLIDVNSNINLLINLLNGIEGILSGIYNISAKTNLLSLNAAIESARAGKEGKGFSVVAEEIRKLSLDTNKETKKIEDLIDKIKEMVKGVTISNTTMEKWVVEGSSYVCKVEDNIKDIYESNKKNLDKLNNLTTTIEDQKQSTKEVTDAISLITNDSIEIESNILETEKINNNIKNSLVENLSKSRKLLSRSKNLEELLKSFKK